MEAETRRIRARSRDLNGRGNGSEEHRQVILPGHSDPIWASDAGPVTGEWSSSRGIRAADRRCEQVVTVPEGTIVIDFERTFRGFQPTGPASVTIGLVLPRGITDRAIEWTDVPYRRSGSEVIVDLDAARKLYADRTQGPEARIAALRAEREQLVARQAQIDAELAELGAAQAEPEASDSSCT